VHALHGLPAVDHRDGGDDGLHPGVGRAHHEGVAAAVGDAPDPDPVLVHHVEGLGMADRVLVVLDLPPRVEVLAGCAVAVPEVAVVEDEGGASLVDERPCIRGLHELLDVAPTAGHHDERERPAARGQVEMAPDRGSLTGELDVLGHGDPPERCRS
jgi:hypothetical protein